MKHEKIRSKMEAIIKSDENGCVMLGNLSDVARQEYFRLHRQLNKAMRQHKRQMAIAKETNGENMTAEDWSNVGETNDCCVHALAATLDIPYGDAHKRLAERGRKVGRGTCFSAMATSLGLVELPPPNTTIRKCMETLDVTKRYLVIVRKHALSIVGGKMVDSLNNPSANRRIKKIFVQA